MKQSISRSILNQFSSRAISTGVAKMLGPAIDPEKKGVDAASKYPTTRDEQLDPLLTSPPKSPRAPEDLRHPERLGHWLSLGWDWTNPQADRYLIHGAFVTLVIGGAFFLWLRSYQRQQQNNSDQQQNNRNKSLVRDLEIRLYNSLPLRATSSLWGKINSYDLPVWMRSGLYDFFCRTYNCDMSEALDSDYKSYKNLSEFFSRRLRPDSRPISEEPGVVSPADGLVLHFGPIQKVGRIEGVKGLNYSVQAFLGLASSDYEQELISDKTNNELYNCIIYLAPGDYHRFHSPAEWTVNSRKHFPGRLLSVRPSLMKRIPEVLHINERVCYAGSWPHGFFSMTAVGATNVGSIKVNFDEVSNFVPTLTPTLLIAILLL